MLKTFFEKSFAPFFTFAYLVAILCPMYLVCVYLNDYPFQASFFSALTWHSHEMLYGFVPLVLCGFLLTASAKWTGKSTTSLNQNIMLCLVWLCARFALFSSNSLIALIIPLLFLIILLIKMLLILKGTKNLVPIGLVLLCLLISQTLFLSSQIYELAYKELSYKFSSLAIFFILYLFSGRLIPFFTNSKYKRNLISLSNKGEVLGVLATLIFFVSYIFDLNELLIISGSILCSYILYRTYRLFHVDNIKVPLLYILNIAHLWLAFFPFFILLEEYNPELVIGNLAYHSLFSGALGLFILGITARVSLGHSGLELKATKLIRFAFYNTIIGSVLRVAIPLFTKDIFNTGLHISMGLWTTGYICLLIAFIPIFTTKRKP